MTTPAEEFRQRLGVALAALKLADRETLWLIGSLATALMSKAGATSWTALRDGLTREAYDNLLRDFQQQGNKLAAEGKTRQVDAIAALALSVVGRTQPDPQTQEGVKLLDSAIGEALKTFHGTHRRTEWSFTTPS